MMSKQRTLVSFSRLFLSVVLLPLSACVSSRVTGSRLSGNEGIDFSKLVIYCDVADDALRDEVETEMAASVGGSYLETVRSIDLLSEAREYSEDETRTRMREIGADGMLRVRVTEYANEAYLAPGDVYTFHGLFYSHTVVEPPQWRERTLLHFGLELVAVDTGRTVWRGTVSSSASGERDLKELASAAGSKLRDRLWRDDLIRGGESR